jgi:hypothetical protein
MRGKRNLKWLILIILATGIRCVKPFEPPAIQSPNSFLVVEGVAIPGTDTTTLILSRSRNLSDTTSFIPERNANVRIVSQSGQVFELIEKSSG